MMRIVIGTPRSARMSVSSSSSQSIGLPANCLARVSRNFMEQWSVGVVEDRFTSLLHHSITPLPCAPARARGDSNLFGYGREYRSQNGLNQRHRTPSPVRLLR